MTVGGRSVGRECYRRFSCVGGAADATKDLVVRPSGGGSKGCPAGHQGTAAAGDVLRPGCRKSADTELFHTRDGAIPR